jgi:hypothetical protein
MDTKMAEKPRSLAADYLVRYCLATGLLAFALPAAAQQPERSFSASLYAGFDHSDNMSQQRLGDSGNIGRLGLSADVNGDRRRLDYSLTGDLSWAEYSGPDLPGALEGALSGYLNFGAPDSVFRWTVRDSIHQSLLLAQGNPTPDNSEFVNTFSTGPTLTFRVGERLALILGGNYSRLTYQESPFDSNSLSATAGVAFAMPAGGNAGLHVSATDTRYVSDALADPNYNFRQAYFRYRSGALANSYLSLDAGYSESENAGATTNGPLLRLSLERQISAVTAFTLSATKALTNAAELRGSEAAGPAAQDNPASALGVAESTSVDAAWTATGRRNSLSLAGGWRDEGYQSASQFDREVAFLGATFSRRMRSTLTGSLSVQYRTEVFADPEVPEFDYQTVSLSLTQRLGRRLNGGLAVAYSHRSDEGFSQFEFSEWRFGLTIGYLLAAPGL